MSNASQVELTSQNLSVPDRIEPVIAWRVWRIGENGLLRSMWFPQVEWPNGTVGKEAVDMAPSILFPWRPGYHGLKSVEEALSYCYKWLPPTIVGQVVLWGEITEYEKGYTAQYAMRRDEWEGVENIL